MVIIVFWLPPSGPSNELRGKEGVQLYKARGKMLPELASKYMVFYTVNSNCVENVFVLHSFVQKQRMLKLTLQKTR